MRFKATYSDVNQVKPKFRPLALDSEAVSQSIVNILNTELGERLFLPEFGSKIKQIIFELGDEATDFIIFNRVTEAIERWDSRVILDINNSSIEKEVDNNSYNVKLVYRIKGLEHDKYELRGVLYSE